MKDKQMTLQSVPMLDLNCEYETINNKVLNAITEVIDSKQFINGPQILELEKQIASYCGTKHAIAVSSGTDALLVALMSLDIAEGDEVITSPFTFFATAGSISRVGAKPVFVDIEPDTFNIDPNLIESKITPRTKAIMPVHLFGQLANMDAILKIAKKHNLFVIEDAAQAIGASQINSDGISKKAGSFGDFGCFSFFPSKNLGCMGDGGIVTCNNSDLAEKCRQLRNHGSYPKYYHSMVGGNFRLDTIQAAVLLQKLPLLDSFHKLRNENAHYFNQNLTNVIKPIISNNNYSIYNQYTIKCDKRDDLQNYLASVNIASNIYYPVSLHLQKCFSSLSYKEGDLPVSESCSQNVLSLPIYPGLKTEQLQYIVEHVNLFNNQ